MWCLFQAIKRNRTKSEGSERTVDSTSSDAVLDIKHSLPCSQLVSSASSPDSKIKDTLPSESRNTGRYTVSQIDDSVLFNKKYKGPSDQDVAVTDAKNTSTVSDIHESHVSESKNGLADIQSDASETQTS